MAAAVFVQAALNRLPPVLLGQENNTAVSLSRLHPLEKMRYNTSAFSDPPACREGEPAPAAAA
jgi:hypothetical protein